MIEIDEIERIISNMNRGGTFYDRSFHCES